MCVLLGEGDSQRRGSRDECECNRSRRVSIFLKRLSSLTQRYFKGRNRLHNRINTAPPAEDRDPDLPRSLVFEGYRLRQINDEMWLLALACDVVRLMLQQVSEIL